MKLLFLAGANSIHSERWVKYFSEKGHDVSWISLGVTANHSIKNINFFIAKRNPIKILRPLKYISFIKKIVQEIKPDIMHVHQLWIDGILGACSGYHPLIITPWGSDLLLGSKSNIKRPLIKYALDKADLITCDGENTRDVMVNLGISSEKIRQICFGVDIQKFRPKLKSVAILRKLNISASPIVISLRSLNPIYDLETFIKAIVLILKEKPDTKFIIAGQGIQKEKLINQAKSLGISESIRFIGNIENEEIPDYLNIADVYVSTALSDSGLSASTAEAMACGLPVVITNTGDNEKWIKHEEGGFIIPIKEPTALADKVVNLLNNNEMRMEFGGNNRRVIEDRNNYNKEMKKMENIYRELING